MVYGLMLQKLRPGVHLEFLITGILYNPRSSKMPRKMSIKPPQSYGRIHFQEQRQSVAWRVCWRFQKQVQSLALSTKNVLEVALLRANEH